MKTIMTLSKLTTIEQLDRFLSGSQVCVYEVQDSKSELYRWIQRTLVQFRYLTLSKPVGVVIRYLMKVSGYSRQQMTRLIKQYQQTGKVVRKARTQHRFTRRYTDEDIRLLAYLDELHETPCGAVMKKLCERAYDAKQGLKYKRLAKISVSHLYNLRQSKHYQQQRRHFTKTQSKPSVIGERRKPNPEGKPGYLRVDTVHQGDQDGQKGVYHINLVDEVVQFEISFSAEKISEHYLKPALERAMERIPYKIRGFHSDNGSEYINKEIAKMLNKLCVEFTKSRARKSNDNALVESKNASVIRKHFGYAHIPQRWASELNATIHEALYRYQNFHRPCFFPETVVDKKGKQRKKYPYSHLMTPFEKLASLPNIEEHLKPGITLEGLTAFANEMSDEQAAKKLQTIKQQIFSKIIKDAS
jgi:transposase InsO family protein